MKTQPFFTLIVPIYNVEKYLSQCLDSIISQPFNDYELILINDGSTDNSLNICKTYAIDNSQLKIINKKNEGASIARNKGIEKATGKYIWFIDSDDYIADNALHILSNNLKNENIEMLGFSNYHHFEKDDIIKENKTNGTTEILSPSLFFNRGYSFECTPWIVVFKTSFIRDNKINFNPKLLIYEDTLFMKHCLVKLKTIKYIEDFLYFYRIRPNSLISMRGVKKVSLTGYIEILKFSKTASEIVDFKDYWYDDMYILINRIYSIYYSLNQTERILFKKEIKDIKQYQLKFSKGDVFGIKLMKVLHNYCLPLYKAILLK